MITIRRLFAVLLLFSSIHIFSDTKTRLLSFQNAHKARLGFSVVLVVVAAAADICLQANAQLSHRAPGALVSKRARAKIIVKSLFVRKNWANLGAACKAVFRPEAETRAVDSLSVRAQHFAREHKTLLSALSLASANSLTSLIQLAYKKICSVSPPVSQVSARDREDFKSTDEHTIADTSYPLSVPAISLNTSVLPAPSDVSFVPAFALPKKVSFSRDGESMAADAGSDRGPSEDEVSDISSVSGQGFFPDSDGFSSDRSETIAPRKKHKVTFLALAKGNAWPEICKGVRRPYYLFYGADVLVVRSGEWKTLNKDFSAQVRQLLRGDWIEAFIPEKK